jgi:hypothetical protein
LRWRFRFNSPRRTISFEFGLDPNEAGQKQRKGAAATIERKGTEPINVVILRVKTLTANSDPPPRTRVAVKRLEVGVLLDGVPAALYLLGHCPCRFL